MVDSVRVVAEMEQLGRTLFRFMTNAIISLELRDWEDLVLELDVALGAARRLVKLQEQQTEDGR